jgi:hypothetical protein
MIPVIDIEARHTTRVVHTPQEKNNAQATETTGANIGYEAQLWRMADALRDTLLPKLISGELRVKDAEKFIERTTL